MYSPLLSKMGNDISDELEAALRKVLDLPEMYITSLGTEEFKNEIRELLNRCAVERSEQKLEK